MIKSVSLVFASFNGAYTLSSMLESLAKLKVPSEVSFEVIAIDNNSQDNTLQLLESYTDKITLRVLQQKTPGKNAALNSIFNSSINLGDLVIFTDDDVIFPPDFIMRYVILANENPDFSLFGGRIEPHWMSEQPSEALLNGINHVVAYALTPKSEGYEKGSIDACKIHGPNMAVRRKVFDSGMKFNEGIGPNGKNYVMGSETDFLHRAQSNGSKAFFDPELVVNHMIRPWQLETEWIKQRAYKAGRSAVHHQGRLAQDNSVPLLFGYPRWSLVSSYKKRLGYLLAKSNSENYYRLVWEAHHLFGYSVEYKNVKKVT